MEKLVYLLFETSDKAGATLRADLLAAADRLATLGASDIVVNVNDDDVTDGSGVTLGTLDPPIRAMVSFWMNNSDDRGAAEKLLSANARGIAGYLVTESVPIINTTQPSAPSARMPGVNMVTCIRKLETISRDDFFRIWYRDHKLVAQQTQSTFGYIRNTVVRPLTNAAPPFDGIVEEFFPVEALSNPKVWFAASSDAELEQNQKTMFESVRRFLDLSGIESHATSRYQLD